MPTPDTNNADQFLGVEDAKPIDETGSGSQDEGVVAGQEPEPQKASEPIDPKTDPKRVEYWQSLADKHKKRAEELERYEPIGKLVDQRADVREAIAEKLQPRREEAPPVPKIEKPVLPARPADYDPVAAIQDPDSPSFKFRASKEKYEEELMSYYDKRETERQQEFERRQQEQIRKEAAAVADATLRAKLSARGIVGDEQEKFITTMSSPESFQLENLISLYEVVQGKQSPDAKKQIDQKQKEMQDRIQKGKAPLPPGVEGGESQRVVQKTEEEDFNASLMDGARAISNRRIAVVRQK